MLGRVLSPDWQAAELDARAADAALRALSGQAELLSARAWFAGAAARDPLFSALGALAERHGVTFGVYGGSARDLFLGEARAPGSDIDFIYDSREAGFLAFQTEAKQLLATLAPDVKADWAADLSKQRPWGARRGATIDKLGVMSDGRVFDFSGTGLSDLAAGHVRFFPDDFALDRLSHVMRAVKLINRYPQLAFDAETGAKIRKAVAEVRAKKLDHEMRTFFADACARFAPGQGTLPGKALGAAHQAYKAAKREPLAGDVIEIITAAQKIVQNGLDAGRVPRLLRDLGLLQLFSDIGLEHQLAPLFPDPEAEWQAQGARLERDAERANIQLAIDSLAAWAKEHGDAGIEALTRSLAPPSTPAGIDRFSFLHDALTGAGLSPARATELVDAAREQLVHTRFGTTFEDRFALGAPQALAPRAGVQAFSSIHQGFWPDVLAFDPDAPHSMHDPSKYVDLRLWPAVVDDAVASGRKIELHEGSAEDAFASIRARGFTEVKRIEVPKGERFNQLYCAHNAATGEVRYVMCEVYGFDRLFHQQMLWRCAGRPGARIAPEQIEVHRQPLRSDVEIYRRYSRALLASPHVPDNVLVGFVNGMRKELRARHEAASRLSELQARFGGDPLAHMAQALRRDGHEAAAEAVDALRATHPVATSDPREVFKRQTLVEAVAALRRDLAAAAPGMSTASAATGDTAHVVDDDFLDQLLFSYKDDAGRTKHLLVTRMPYGELAHSLGKAFVDRGVKQVLVMGTAGGLRPESELDVGDAVLAERFRLPDGRMYGLDRDTLLDLVAKREDLPLPKGVRLHGKTAMVRTPLEESASMVEEYRAAGYDLLEMEVGHMAAALKGSGVALSAVNIVSDVPGSTHTLESHLSDAAVKQKFKALADHLIALFDIEAMLPRAGGGARGFEKARDVAALLAGEHAEDPSYSVYRYNLARYVLNGTPEHLLADPTLSAESLAAAPDLIAPRWREKVARDCKAPYDDAAVLRELDAKEAQLRAAAIYLRDSGKAPPDTTLHLMGGLTKGRFGGGSDLDLLVDSSDPGFNAWALRSEVGALNPDAQEIRLGELAYAKARNERYASFEPLGSLDDIADGRCSLRALLERKMADAGVTFDTTHGHTDASRATVTREVPEVDEYLFEHEKAFKAHLDTGVLLKYIGAPIDAQEFRAYKLRQLQAMGDTIADRLFGAHLDAERLLAYFGSAVAETYWQSPRGQKRLAETGARDSGEWLRKADHPALAAALAELHAEELADLAGLRDPVERLAFLLAGMSRLKTAAQRSAKPNARIDAATHMYAAERLSWTLQGH